MILLKGKLLSYLSRRILATNRKWNATWKVCFIISDEVRDSTPLTDAKIRNLVEYLCVL